MMRKATTVDRAKLIPIVTFTFLALAAMVLSGCNTTAGLGRDIEATGSAIEGTAEDASD
jgi:predicted small secreted protein